MPLSQSARKVPQPAAQVAKPVMVRLEAARRKRAFRILSLVKQSKQSSKSTRHDHAALLGAEDRCKLGLVGAAGGLLGLGGWPEHVGHGGDSERGRADEGADRGIMKSVHLAGHAVDGHAAW